MLRGDLVGLRERRDADVPVLHAELYDDVATWSRAHSEPWRPIAADSDDSPYAVGRTSEGVAGFSVVTLVDDVLVGDALLWGIDPYNGTAHVGLSLFASARGRGLGTDVVRVLCRYGFGTRGLRRLQVDTLADNHAMIAVARVAGFELEGTLRSSSLVAGSYLDDVILGLLATDWSDE